MAYFVGILKVISSRISFYPVLWLDGNLCDPSLARISHFQNSLIVVVLHFHPPDLPNRLIPCRWFPHFPLSLFLTLKSLCRCIIKTPALFLPHVNGRRASISKHKIVGAYPFVLAQLTTRKRMLPPTCAGLSFGREVSVSFLLSC